MTEPFRFTTATRHQPAIDEWLASEPQQLFAIANHWFVKFRQCGNDVTELMHDGCPTACVQDAAALERLIKHAYQDVKARLQEIGVRA